MKFHISSSNGWNLMRLHEKLIDFVEPEFLAIHIPYRQLLNEFFYWDLAKFVAYWLLFVFTHVITLQKGGRNRWRTGNTFWKRNGYTFRLEWHQLPHARFKVFLYLWSHNLLFPFSYITRKFSWGFQRTFLWSQNRNTLTSKCWNSARNLTRLDQESRNIPV